MPDSLTVLLVEDDAALRMASSQALQLAGIEARGFELAEHARDALYPGFPGVIVTDVRLPGMDGLALLQYALRDRSRAAGHPDHRTRRHLPWRSRRCDGAPTISSRSRSRPNVWSTPSGARCERASPDARSRSAAAAAVRPRGASRRCLLGQSAAIQQVCRRQMLQLADTSADVIIFGETGTGKELVARCLHDFSPRAATTASSRSTAAPFPRPCSKASCSATKPGAFTGAGRQRIGKFEYAHGGTLLPRRDRERCRSRSR